MRVPLQYAHRSVCDVEQLDVFIMEMDGSASVSEAAVWPQLCLSVADINMFKLPYVATL